MRSEREKKTSYVLYVRILGSYAGEMWESGPHQLEKKSIGSIFFPPSYCKANKQLSIIGWNEVKLTRAIC